MTLPVRVRALLRREVVQPDALSPHFLLRRELVQTVQHGALDVTALAHTLRGHRVRRPRLARDAAGGKDGALPRKLLRGCGGHRALNGVH